jgi:hypothetical protein
MYKKNQADANENSVAAINNGNGHQTIDNSTTIVVKGFVNLASTLEGKITFDPKVMREVIVTIDASFENNGQVETDFDVIDIKNKNLLNGLSQDFYDEQILLKYEPFFARLEIFLKERVNEDLRKKVENIAESLNRKIATKRKSFDTFEDLLIDIESSLMDAEYSALQGKDSSICLFLFYLYASCLIGKKTEKEKL